SQLQRLADGRVAPDDFDLPWLRYDAGRRGWNAAVALRGHPAWAGDAERLGALERLLAREHRWGVDGDGSKAGSPQRSVEALKAQVQLAAGAATPDEDWWASLRPGLGGRNCATASDDCILLTPDLDGD